MNRNAPLREFFKTYLKAIDNSNAAIFAGAGLSRPAGYVDWKELLKDVADDLDLDIDQETDLISLAQYHVNEFNGRSKINQVLIDEFTETTRTTENHKILASLPINTYWTTNYDNLIESNLVSKGKKVDIKITSENLTHTVPDSDAVIYKMHGDQSLPHEAVLTRDDYEEYDLKRELFTTALRGDLVSKTFLFIGFSFDDPNLSQILSKVRILLRENARNHYCIMKKVNSLDYSVEGEFAYAELKQNLKIKDLKRYGIQVILIDDYSEITSILNTIKLLIKKKNIFISGSAHEYGKWGQVNAFRFCTNLSKELIRNGNNIVTGFGLGIGSCIIAGALEELYSSGTSNIEQKLITRPFPQVSGSEGTIKELWKKYREDMLQNVGIAIFIFGNKFDENSSILLEANGMEEEFEIAIKNKVIPIPIGVTGYTAQKLWERTILNFDTLINRSDIKELYDLLNHDEKSEQELINVILDIINKIN